MVSAGVGTPCIWEVLEPASLVRQGDTLFPSQTTGAGQSNFIFISYFYFLVGSFQKLWVRWAPPSNLHPASWPKPHTLERSSCARLCGMRTVLLVLVWERGLLPFSCSRHWVVAGMSFSARLSFSAQLSGSCWRCMLVAGWSMVFGKCVGSMSSCLAVYTLGRVQ